MLTDAACRSAKPKAAPYKLADGKGLHLHVSRTGHRSWRWKYRYKRTEKLLTLGSYPDVGLATARERREDAARMLRQGMDPAAQRKEAAAVKAVEEENTFEIVARRWHENQKAGWAPKHAADVLVSLTRDVFPELGPKPITSITVPMVLKVLQEIEARPAIETARRVRQRIEAVFASAIASGIAKDNPAAVITPAALKPLLKHRQPAFRELEAARSLLRDSEAAPAHPLTKLASRLLALTVARPGIIRVAQPAEFLELDGEAPYWHVPAAKMKLQLERKGDQTFDFIFPLAWQAVDVLKAALQLVGSGPYLFPNTRHMHRPMSENAIGYMYNRLPAYRGRHVPHGWRATFSTVMNELAIARGSAGDRAILDLMLAHIPGGVEAAYNRAAYMPRRRELAQEWADMLLKDFPPAEQLLNGRRS